MLGLVRSVCTRALKPSVGPNRRVITRSKPRKLSQLSKKYSSAAKIDGKIPQPGSAGYWRAFQALTREGAVVDYKTPERILTIDDLEVNREAATLNARLRYLVSTAAPYEEARKLAEEAQANGVELDFHSYILLSTLFKPELRSAWDALGKNAASQIQEFVQTFVPETDILSELFGTIKSGKDSEALVDILNFITERRAKLDVTSLEAMFNAFASADMADKAPAAFHTLHKDYLIDTATFDAFLTLHPNLRLL